MRFLELFDFFAWAFREALLDFGELRTQEGPGLVSDG